VSVDVNQLEVFSISGPIESQTKGIAREAAQDAKQIAIGIVYEGLGVAVARSFIEAKYILTIKSPDGKITETRTCRLAENRNFLVDASRNKNSFAITARDQS
jgi:hypothetical protein